MAADVIEIHGFDELMDALEKMPQTIQPLLREAMVKSLSMLQDGITEYPPSTEANQPGRFSLRTRLPMGYYERGAGWWYPVTGEETLKPQKRAGVVSAPWVVQETSEVNEYRLSRTSEDLKESWTQKVEVTERGVEGVLGTNTSYAEHVQGNKQAAFHKARGWKTIDQVLEENRANIQAAFGQAVSEWLDQLAKE